MGSFLVGILPGATPVISSAYGMRSEKGGISPFLPIPENDDLQASVQPAVLQDVYISNIKKTQYWGQLPQELLDIIASGKIPLTSGKCQYDQYLGNNLLGSGNPEDNELLLFHVGGSGIPGYGAGRSSYLIERNGEGNIIPKTVKIGNETYIIELKGSGIIQGGFRSYKDGDMDIGSLQRDEANREFDMIQSLHESPDSSVYVAGNIYYELDGKQHSYIVRLVPTSLRTSYVALGGFSSHAPDIHEDLISVLEKQFLGEKPRFVGMRGFDEEGIFAGIGEFARFGHQIYFGDDTLSGASYSGERLGYEAPGVNGVVLQVKSIFGTLFRDQYLGEMNELESRLIRNTEASELMLPAKDLREVQDRVLGVVSKRLYEARRKNQFSPAHTLELLQNLCAFKNVTRDKVASCYVKSAGHIFRGLNFNSDFEPLILAWSALRESVRDLYYLRDIMDITMQEKAHSMVNAIACGPYTKSDEWFSLECFIALLKDESRLSKVMSQLETLYH